MCVVNFSSDNCTRFIPTAPFPKTPPQKCLALTKPTPALTQPDPNKIHALQAWPPSVHLPVRHNLVPLLANILLHRLVPVSLHHPLLLPIPNLHPHSALPRHRPAALTPPHLERNPPRLPHPLTLRSLPHPPPRHLQRRSAPPAPIIRPRNRQAECCAKPLRRGR